MSFDALAPHYGWMEFIFAGKKLQRCRTAFLDEITAPRNILLLGEGHGRFLIECCHRFRKAQITCVDASAAMISQTRRRLAGSRFPDDQVNYVHADVLAWTPPSKDVYDLIVTHFFLDCFRAEQLDRIIRTVGGASAPNANWLLADFQVASGKAARLRSAIILWMMYSFFRATTRLAARKLTLPDSYLRRAGFHLRCGIQSEWGLLHSDWWQRGE